MIQHKRNGIIGIVSLLLLAHMALAAAGEAKEAGDQAVVLKSYELKENADYVEFAIEGYGEPFQTVMTLPGGSQAKAGRSQKQACPSGTCFRQYFVVKPAPKGVYAFEIKASKPAYFNLLVDIPPFADIANHWAKDAITDMAKQGIVSGYGNGKFGPGDPVTGEALIKMLAMALTEELPNGKRQWTNAFRWKMLDDNLGRELSWKEYDFASPAGQSWSAPYLAAANDLGIASHWNQADWGKSFKRKDVALLAAELLRLVSDDQPKESNYADTAGLEGKYRAAINLVSDNSIFGGYPDGTFKPETAVTRAEAVKVLSRLTAMIKN
jgi:S-layer homology domain.